MVIQQLLSCCYQKELVVEAHPFPLSFSGVFSTLFSVNNTEMRACESLRTVDVYTEDHPLFFEISPVRPLSPCETELQNTVNKKRQISRSHILF